MSAMGTGLLVMGGAIGASMFWFRYRREQRMRHLREARLPPGVHDKLHRQRPDIAPEHYPLIDRALRDFFAAYLLGGGKPVSMPSQAADELWHEFILHTRHYEQFCRKAFGRFLHHTPAVALSRNYERNVGLRRVWWHTCKLEGIDPRNPTRLPLLFALDARLGLADGFTYALTATACARKATTAMAVAAAVRSAPPTCATHPSTAPPTVWATAMAAAETGVATAVETAAAVAAGIESRLLRQSRTCRKQPSPRTPEMQTQSLSATKRMKSPDRITMIASHIPLPLLPIDGSNAALMDRP